MGLYDIHIDLTKCKNRTVIIRGDNGSGKSTLSKAMSLFPDPNDSFIPGLPARKEIVLVDGLTLYKLVFVHGIKQNGDRETTKAYITKTFNNTAVELNQNGNVTSYKEILYSELGLDANFAALSQLSNDDRGLADKKPAERKRFVNSIIASLETYNNIYKTLTKRSSNFKSMINAVAAKLNMLGDEQSMISGLEAVEDRINQVQDSKDKAIASLASEKSLVALLDPDGSIQNNNAIVMAELSLAQNEFNSIQAVINSLISSNGITSVDFSAEYRRIVDTKNSLIIDNRIAKNNIDSLMSQYESESNLLNQRMQKMASLNSGYSYESVLAAMEECEAKLKAISTELTSKLGNIDIKSISKEEYILALETMKDLDRDISIFKSCIDFSVIQSLVTEYIQTGRIPTPIDPANIISNIAVLEKDLRDTCDEITSIESGMGILSKLNLRPSDCTSEICPFIKDALDFSKTDPISRKNSLEGYAKSISDQLDELRLSLSKAMEFNDAINKFSIIIRSIDKNGAILSKLPNGEMFNNKVLFLDRLISGYSFEYMQSIYQHIDLANLFESYKTILELYRSHESELRVYDSKAEIITALMDDIDRINKSLSSITDTIEPIKREIHDRDIRIVELEKMEGIYTAILDNLDRQAPVSKKISECKNKIAENQKKVNEINAALARATSFGEEIGRCNMTLAPLLKERDKISHSIQMMKDYKVEKEELQANYDFIETIKYYSSPTTGIQLVFMELYMGKIIALANELLKHLFNGQFVIQPFVINETEFRIPCLGNGYLNDDISSMSSSQIGMISMILSFALLHHSSTKYNIIKLDEIDGPLDYTNRMFFADVLNTIMDIMGTEQCIMISHNSELQLDNSDVILLKHDENNLDYQRGNIIWSY